MTKSSKNLLIFFALVALYAVVFFGLLFLYQPAGIAWLGISFIAWLYWVIKGGTRK